MNEAYINQLKLIMRSGQNPTEFFARAVCQNPELQQIFSLLKSGGDPQKIYENLARQRGIDPNQLINKLMS